MTGSLSIPRGSIEYLRAKVIADTDLASTGVALAIVHGNDTKVWLAGQWIENTGSTRTARTTAAVTLDVGTYPSTTYDVYVKLTDSPETPILHAYTLNIT